MVHHPSIEKHLKGLKNISRGDRLEALHSITFHTDFVPVLISSRLLRQNGCGQIDLAYFDRGKLIILEIKNSPEMISHRQKKRLYKSREFLEWIFHAPCYLRIIKSLPKDLSPLNLNI